MSKTRSRLPKAPAAPTRKHLARAERERRLQRWLIGVVAVLLAITAGLIAYPIVLRQFVQPGQPVAVVNGVEISTNAFQKRARYARGQLINQYWNLAQLSQYFGGDAQFQSQLNEVTALLNSSFALGRDVLDQMIAEELIRQEAARRGLSVSPEELDQEIREAFRYYPGGTPTPQPTLTRAPTDTLAPTATGQPSATPTEAATATSTASAAPTDTPTPGPTATASPVPSITPTATPYTQDLFDRDYGDFLRQYQREAGMTEADLRGLFEVQILRRKLTEAWEAEPGVGSVHARHILVADEEAAKDILAQLEAGGDFAALAAEFSTDPSNKDAAGDLGFFGRGQMVPEFEAAAFDSPVGLVPEPVQTSFGWHVIEVLEQRDESLEDAQSRSVADWLQAQRDDEAVVQTFDYWEERVPQDPPFDPQVPPTAFPTSEP
jgi:parvulin-like peptidyl-prolyl isomerase